VAVDPATTGRERDGSDPRRPTVRVRVDSHGPTYVEGPVELSLDGQDPVLIDRFTVAICACRRSRRYPLCDNSHLTPPT
jgi:CDGSH-type Zn-finger protein